MSALHMLDPEPIPAGYHEWRVREDELGFWIERHVRGREYQTVPILFETEDAALRAIAVEVTETQDLGFIPEAMR